MAMTLKVVVPPHPLIAHWLTMLRNVSTPGALYSTGLEELGRWLTYEALREWLPTRQEAFETSHGKGEGIVIEANIPLLAIPNMPGGLELWQGGRNVLPNAHLCIGGVPNSIETNAGVIIYVDQIATGRSLLQTLLKLHEKKVETKRVRVITSLSSNKGLTTIGESFPELTIYSACIDAELNQNGEIVPGIGNPALRLNTRIAGSN